MHRFLQLSCLVWTLLLLLVAQVALAVHGQAPATALAARQQQQRNAAGSSCSDEGQWNCMTSSWQRCAAGRWSVVMPCAKGTTCAPAGLTRDFRIQHDGSVDKNGGPPTTSAGVRRWASRGGIFGAVLGWLWWCG